MLLEEYFACCSGSPDNASSSYRSHSRLLCHILLLYRSAEGPVTQTILEGAGEKRKAQEEEEKAREAKREAEERERAIAEERRLALQAEEKARRELEEYLKKPTFAERVVETCITKQGFYKWEWKYSAEAVDVATWIEAKAKNYESEGGAKEHARINLKAILLERGVIRKD